MNSDEITRDILKRADRATFDRALKRLIVFMVAVSLMAVAWAAFGQKGQHSVEYRDGCGNRFGDYVEIGSLADRVPLPPRVCKRVDKGLPTERLVIINWIEDGYREIP